MRYLWAEAIKLAGLPATWVGTALAILLPALVAGLNGLAVARAIDTGELGGLITISTVNAGYGELTLGVIGVLVVAVTSASGEYAKTGQSLGRTRQVSSTLVAMPRRLELGGAKLSVLAGWVTLVSAVVIPAALAASGSVLGSRAPAVTPGRVVGVWAFYLTMACVAHAVTTLARSGIIPLTLFIANASAVSFGLLLSKVTPLVVYLPDIAASSLFLLPDPVADAVVVLPRLDAAAAPWVLAVWCGASVLVTMTAWRGRDA